MMASSLLTVNKINYNTNFVVHDTGAAFWRKKLFLEKGAFQETLRNMMFNLFSTLQLSFAENLYISHALCMNYSYIHRHASH